MPRSTSSPAKALVSLKTRRERTRLLASTQGSPPDCALVVLRGTSTNPGLAGDNPIEKTGAWTAEGDEEIVFVPPIELCPRWIRVARRRGLKGDSGGEIADSE